jgi:hypothetical protein
VEKIIEFGFQGIKTGSPVIVNLHTPREKLWGLMQEINASGVFLRGIDLNTFDDWTMMLSRGESNIGLSYLFFPMWRIERISLDETIDEIPSLADQFHQRLGLSIFEFFSK